jgi:cytochrome b pre-mRNA-processing protein 3
MILKNFFARAPRQTCERRLYEAIVAQARQPEFYADLHVPDTVQGRFDMIVLHSFLVMEHLSGKGEEASAFSQSLFDELFRDMDRSLREMGVGDLSVGKRINKMAQVFYGRCDAYREAIAVAPEDGAGALKAALMRNIFEMESETPEVDALAQYVLENHRHLAACDIAPILSGEITFAGP